MGILIGVIGGLGLFIYGMNIMGEALQKSAGNRLKSLIEKLTKNRLMGILVGTIVTMIIQSSSATTVMTVGFVNAGLMTLAQSVGVIMGANLGTTVTAQLVAFKLTDIAPLFIGVGVALWLFAKKKKVKDIAEIFIGFGILFVGMGIMSDSLAPLSKSKEFAGIMLKLENPLLGVLVGFIITTILQSSSASTGILLSLASTGLISIEMALPIIYGGNIGTTTTALISSIGTSKAAKQTAVIHFIFNVTGALLFLTLLGRPLELLVKELSPGEVNRQIANSHTIFNLANIIIMYPFAGLIVKAAQKIVKSGDDEEQVLKYIDDRIVGTHPIAVAQASREVLRMGKKVLENLDIAMESFYKKDEKLVSRVLKNEAKINEIQNEILKFLAKLGGLPLSDEERKKVTILFHAITDIERVGDHAENIAEQTQYRIENKLSFSEGAIEELKFMFDKTLDLYKNSLLAFKTGDKDIANSVVGQENEVDEIEKKYRASHIERLNRQECQPSSGIVYLDIINNLERVGDHSSNISQYIVDILEGKDKIYLKLTN